MKRFRPIRRLLAAVLVCIMFLGSIGLPAKAASPELPDLSAFLDSPYTQNVKGTYTNYVTCTYPKEEGTAPLDEFLSLLQESRYHLKYTGKSQSYKDSYSSATCTDHLFQYTGSASGINLITTKSGDSYHVKVTLYTYTDQDYSAIVFYREPGFSLADSGVHYGDKPARAIPGLHEYFKSADRKTTAAGGTSYFFSYSSQPSAEMRDFSSALQNLELEATEQLEMAKGSRLQLFCADEAVLITVWWHEGDKQIEVTLCDEALETAGYSQTDTKMASSNATSRNSSNWYDYDYEDDSYLDTTTKKTCFSCGGTGRCSTCGGSGRLEHVTSTVVGNYCRTCSGGGRCGFCGGSGYNLW